MSERELVLALGAREGYGELVTVASPSYAAEVGCVLPMGLILFVACVVQYFREKHNWFFSGLEVAELIAGVVVMAMLARPWAQRRPGGSEPRLYCFVDGVVVAVTSQLTAYRWNEVRVETKDWSNTTGDEVESGTRTAVFVDATGAFIVQFTGREPGKAGAGTVQRLHKKALERAADA